MKATTALRRMYAKLFKLEHTLLLASTKVVMLEQRPVASGETFQRRVLVSLRDESGKVVRDSDTRKVVRVPVTVTCHRTVSQDWKSATRKRQTAARKLREAERKLAMFALTMPTQDVVAIAQ